MEPNTKKYPTVHRYFLHAIISRGLLQAELDGNNPNGPIARLHLELWCACLVPVLEGWKKEKINDAAVTAFIRQKRRVNLLTRSRNAVFHYSPDYFDERFVEMLSEKGMVEWVRGLHDAIDAFFLAKHQ
jgi:hypothetical protein